MKNINEVFYVYFFVLGPWYLVCLLHLEYISFWTGHIPCTQYGQVWLATCIGQSRAFGKSRKVDGNFCRQETYRQYFNLLLPAFSSYACFLVVLVLHMIEIVCEGQVCSVLRGWFQIHSWFEDCRSAGKSARMRGNHRPGFSPADAIIELLSPLDVTSTVWASVSSSVERRSWNTWSLIHLKVSVLKVSHL